MIRTVLFLACMAAIPVCAQQTAANWIWYPESASGDCVDQTRYFRKTFDLPEGVGQALLSVVVDDRQTVYANGQGPLQALERENAPTTYDLAGILRPGRNVIAVAGHNVTGPAGLIARLVLTGPDGKETVIGSDAGWMVSREEQEGWTGADFDASAWAEAAVIGPAFTDPWMQFPGYHCQEMASEQELADYRAFQATILAPPEQFASDRKVRPKLRMQNGVPTLWINGAPYPAVMYRGTVDPASALGRRQITNFAEAGIHLECLYTTLLGCWKAPGEYDFSSIDTLIRSFLSADPDAYVLLHIRLVMPDWWMAANPDEWVRYGTGDDLDSGDESFRVKRASPASDVWLRDALEVWRAAIRHIEQQPWGKRVLGYHAGYGIYTEWHYFGSWSDQYPDTGPAMTRRFRRWLQEQYGTVEALRRAWRDERVTFETAEVPGVEPRKTATLGTVRDPFLERPVIDYYRCHQQVIADDIEAFGKAAKQETRGNAVYGVYYGYFIGVRPQAQGGHLELERLLKSPYIDFFVAPYSYADRLMGDDGRLRSLAGAITRAGKVHFIEADIRTYLHSRDEYGRTRNLTESLAAIRREFATSLIEHTGFWYVDFGPDSRGGWFDDPAIMAEIKALQRVAEENLGREADSVAEIAVICDLESGYMLGDGEGMTQAYGLVEGLTGELYRLGAPFDTLFLSQLQEADLSRYKVLVFLNTLHMTDSQAAQVAQLRRSGRCATIFVWAPALCGPESLAVERAAQVTGLDLSLLKQSLPARVELTEAGAALAPGIPARTSYAIQPTGGVPVAEFGDAGKWLNPRTARQMAESYALYETATIERGIAWSFETSYPWTDIHLDAAIPDGDGIGFDVKLEAACPRLMLRTVIKDANWAEFVTESEVIAPGDWKRLDYPLAAFTNAPWSKLKPEQIARPIRGMKFVLDGTNTAGKCTVSLRGLEATTGPVSTTQTRVYGEGVFTPALIPSAGGGQVLGRIAETGEPAVVLAGEGLATSLFSAVPQVPREFLLEVLRQAGVHRYIDAAGDVLRADSRYICIHTKEGGARTLRLPVARTVRDAVSKQVLGEGTAIELELPENSTTLMELVD